MTHLVEMQQALPKLEAAGVKLYAVSYDSPEALADFRRSHGIEYTLLSDTNSRVIREYGILNTFIEEHEAPFYGIPFPGTYVIDQDGRVVEKFFERHVGMRESAETFIDTALGDILLGLDEPRARGGDGEIGIDVAFHGGSTLKSGLKRRIVVRFELPEGLHIYGEPVPAGMVATTVEVRGPEGLRVEPMIQPPTESLRLPGLDAELRVWSGRVDLVVPVWADDRLVPLIPRDGQPTAAIDVSVRYQACDEATCRIPRTESFSLEVPIAAATAPRLSEFRGSPETTSMSTGAHLRRMVFRSLLRRPWLALKTLAFLRWNASAIREGPGLRGRGRPSDAD